MRKVIPEKQSSTLNTLIVSKQETISHNQSFIQECPICLNQRQLIKMCKCEHLFCQQCLQTHVENRLRFHEEIKCCESNCEKVITTKPNKGENYLYSFMSDQVKKSVKKSLKSHNQMRDSKMKCLNCKGKACDCDSMEIELPASIKKCLNCQKYLEKQKGCNHLKCKCGHEFCFECGDTWEINHICLSRIPQRQGLALVFCCFFKILLGIMMFPFILLFFLVISSSICLVSGLFLGFIIFLILVEQNKKIQSNCCKCTFFIILLVFLPAIWAIFIIPGLFLPWVNTCWEKKIFLDPSVLSSLVQQFVGCYDLLKLI